MTVKDTQVGGDHYRKLAIQPWDIIEAHNLDFWEGNAIKYILRHKDNRLEDLKKAQHYLDYLIEREKNKSPDAVETSESLVSEMTTDDMNFVQDEDRPSYWASQKYPDYLITEVALSDSDYMGYTPSYRGNVLSPGVVSSFLHAKTICLRHLMNVQEKSDE